MMKRIKIFFTLTIVSFLAAATLQSCDPYGQDEYRELVVVETYLTANNPFPEIRVSRTLPASVEYTFEAAALNGAVVSVTELDQNGNEISTLFFERDGDGVYRPEEEQMVEPLTTYRLDISFNDRDDQLTAFTTVPDQIQVIGEIPESIIYQGPQQLEVLLSETERVGSQNYYIFTSIAVDPVEANLTPFYKSAFENDDDAELSDFFNNSSGLVNEGNFTVNEDGTTTLVYPWIGVAFYGENDIVSSSVDRNIYDLLRSQQVQLGGSTLPPGEIPNIIYNVEGGIGVFGSFSADTVRVNFE